MPTWVVGMGLLFSEPLAGLIRSVTTPAKNDGQHDAPSSLLSRRVTEDLLAGQCPRCARGDLAGILAALLEPQSPRSDPGPPRESSCPRYSTWKRDEQNLETSCSLPCVGTTYVGLALRIPIPIWHHRRLIGTRNPAACPGELTSAHLASSCMLGCMSPGVVARQSRSSWFWGHDLMLG